MIVTPNFKPISFDRLKKLNVSRGYGVEKCGYVYLLGFQGKTKIGHSLSPYYRISESFTMGGMIFPDVWVSDQIKYCDFYEYYLHSMFKEFHIVKEWFDVTPKTVSNSARKVKVENTGSLGRSRFELKEIPENFSLFEMEEL